MARRARAEAELRLPPIRGVGHADDVAATAHYDDPAYYDKAYRDRRDDVAYYVRAARLSGGPVLEYGVGTGRIALELARVGVEVVGVDRSRPMLSKLREHLGREPPDVRRRLRVVSGDMRGKRLGRRFPLVIAPFNAVLHLYDRADFERFFARVREHLAPRGRFVFDVLVPHADYLGADPERRYGSPRFKHPERGMVRYGERFEYDALRQVLLMGLEFEPLDGSAPWTVPLTHRQLFPRELEALLHYNGFEDLVWTSDFTDALAEGETHSLVVSCRAGKPPRGRAWRARRE